MSNRSRSGAETFRRLDLEAWCAGALQRAGVGAADAATASSLLVRTDARGGATHGLSRLRSYMEKLATGEVAADARPKVERNQCFLRVDAGRALGQVAGPYAVDAAVELTGEAPAVICTLRDTGHLGALGTHVLRAAEVDRVAMLMQATPPLVSVPGGTGPMLGNNPLAIAAPRPGAPPLVIDLACSVAARGNILLASRAGDPIPDGWALDETGRPTTDATAALKGSLLPFGGVKGLMIAALVEILAGSLSGAAYESNMNAGGQVRSAPGSVNAFLMVLNPKLMNGWPEYCCHVAAWTETYRAAGGPEARIPGERAFAQERESEAHGIALDPGTLDDLRRMADEHGIPFPPASGRTDPDLGGR